MTSNVLLEVCSQNYDTGRDVGTDMMRDMGEYQHRVIYLEIRPMGTPKARPYVRRQHSVSGPASNLTHHDRNVTLPSLGHVVYYLLSRERVWS